MKYTQSDRLLQWAVLAFDEKVCSITDYESSHLGKYVALVTEDKPNAILTFTTTGFQTHVWANVEVAIPNLNNSTPTYVYIAFK